MDDEEIVRKRLGRLEEPSASSDCAVALLRCAMNAIPVIYGQQTAV